MEKRIIEYKKEFEKEIKDLIKCIYVEEFKIEVGKEAIINEDIYGYIKNGGNFWIAVDEENNLLGTIGGKIINGDTIEIKRMYVKKEYRGCGVAQSLLDTLENYARQNGFKYLILGTYEKMERAIGFYTKNLFELETLESQFQDERFFRKCIV